MSITIEDKLEQFSKRIFGQIETESEEKKKELIQKYKIEIEKHTAEIEAKKQEIINAAFAKAENERIRIIAQAKNVEHHSLISKKQQFMQQIMKKLSGFAVEFTETSEYRSYMSSNIKALLHSFKDSSRIVIYAMKKDMELCKELFETELKATGRIVSYEVLLTSKDIVGGLIAEDVENLLQVDFTLKALLDESKDTVGAAITRKFNEVSSL